MTKRKRSLTFAIIAMVLFWIVAVINIWKLIGEKPDVMNVIPAGCFSIAAMAMTISVVRIRKANRDE